MATYRQVYLTFWTDPKVDDCFTPEDKYFYLYLLTNPHTNLCGCYEISTRQMVRETGYNEDTIMRLIERMEKMHNVIRYSKDTKEVLILNWHKYNWNKSSKIGTGVTFVAKSIKCKEFRDIVDRVCIGYGYPMDTSVTVTVTDSVTDSVTDKPKKSVKHKHGEFQNVLLTDEELQKLKDRFPLDWNNRIETMSKGIEMKGYKYKSHYLAILDWARREVPNTKEKPVTDTSYDSSAFIKKASQPIVYKRKGE